ncbi:MAG TPA: pyridoxamine 5'-phosphate oxidase family protein [Azospirillaceae bacterium]|nr:pyridoxamine 5'-phosphate oxidase family protein [Azospirillaceae bacterium]HRQ80197.1 pyridoxamine 5'-phosphate oxidase family protein [Azospirillaceae bacterium]
MDASEGVLHDGELAAQARFGLAAEGAAMSRMIRGRLTPAMLRFIEAQAFFFLATANRAGECDCSFRGRQHAPPAPPEPIVAALDDRTLVFPDYPGNNLFNSLGNIIDNPQVGLLFVDFAKPARVRVNGRAAIIDDMSDFRSLWPDAPRGVRVAVTQAFGNCSQRIPILTPAG